MVPFPTEILITPSAGVVSVCSSIKTGETEVDS